MADLKQLGRCRFLARAAGSMGALMLGGCDRLSGNPEFTKLLKGAEAVSRFCAADRHRPGRASTRVHRGRTLGRIPRQRDDRTERSRLPEARPK